MFARNVMSRYGDAHYCATESVAPPNNPVGKRGYSIPNFSAPARLRVEKTVRAIAMLLRNSAPKLGSGAALPRLGGGVAKLAMHYSLPRVASCTIVTARVLVARGATATPTSVSHSATANFNCPTIPLCASKLRTSCPLTTGCNFNPTRTRECVAAGSDPRVLARAGRKLQSSSSSRSAWSSISCESQGFISSSSSTGPCCQLPITSVTIFSTCRRACSLSLPATRNQGA